MDSHGNSEHFKPAKYPQLLTFLGVVGSMLLFLVILAITYIPSDKAPVEGNIVAMREATFEANYAAQRKSIDETKVVDPTSGIYKIPVSDAIDITAAKLQTK